MPSAIKAKQLKDCDAKLKGLKAKANGSQLPKEDVCMRKFLFGALLIVLFLTSMVLPVAALQPDNAIETAAQQLDSTIDSAIEKGDRFAEKDFTTDSIQITKTAEKLVEKTEKIIEKLERKIEGEDFVLVKEYIEVDIGGVTVSVDPFHVF